MTSYSSRLLTLLLLVAASPFFAVPLRGGTQDLHSLNEKGASSCRWTPGFHQPGLGRSPSHSIVFDDGSGPALYVGGDFETAGDQVVNYIAKWDGTEWSALGQGFDNSVLHLEVFDDGTGPALYATGFFLRSGTTILNGIAKWDGQEWLPLGSGFADPPGWPFAGGHTMEVFDDGTGPALIVGGQFTSAGGVPAEDLAKWDGNSWSAWGSGTDAEGWIWALEVGDLGDGETLYVSGTFTELDGQAITSVAKWNGTGFSALGSGLDGWIGSLELFDDGSGLKLYAAGVFWWGGVLKANARWDGSSWALYGQHLNGEIADLQLYDDGTGEALYAIGQFQYADFVPTPMIAKWDGVAWSAIGGGLSGSRYAYSLGVFDDGGGPDLYAGGEFTHAGGQLSPFFARWDGATWSKVGGGGGQGLSASVRVLTVFDGGAGPELYAGGEFLKAGDIAADHVARWNGSAWSALGSGTNHNVLTMISFDDGSGPALYAGGEFTTAGGSPANRVAKWTGSAWEPLGAGINGAVHTFEVFDDGTGPALYAGGLFSSAGGQSAANIAKWNGSAWSAVGAGTSDAVLALRAFDPGGGKRLFVGGVFGSAGGQPASFLASWDGAWSAVAGSPNLHVFALETFDFGAGPALHVGGATPASGGVSHPLVYSWNGMTWTALAADSGMNDFVVDFASFDDGSGTALFAGGRFNQVDGQEMKGVAKWNGTSWSELGSGIRAFWLEDIEVFDDGAGPALYAAGGMETAGGVASRSIARYSCAGPPTLKVPASTPAAAGGTVIIPITLDPAGVTLGGAAFSIDYDQSCLDPDANHDGVLDQLLFSAPGFTTIAQFNPLDTDGEIDISIFDAAPPIAALPGGQIAQVRFTITCAGPKAAPIVFSSSPAPTFGDLRANNVEGTSQGGVVQVLPGPRGDCNGSGGLGVPDLTAIGLEIFDGDGDLWLDAPGSTYHGSPVGCDANASTRIQAADITCANLLIFGGVCAAPLAEPGASSAQLELSAAGEGGIVWLRARLVRNGAAVGSLAFSLDLDPAGFDLAAADRDRDGRPDRLRFPQGEPGFASIRLDAADTDGELDVLLADLAQRPLVDGVLVEIGFPATRASRRAAFRLAKDPAPSFGSAAGGDLPGIAVVGNLP